MHIYLKANLAYLNSVFRPDEDDRESSEWQYKNNVFKRYMYYIVDDLYIVDDAHGGYVRYSMPSPLNIPGRIYLWLEYIWQVKIRKTHI